MSDQRKIGDLTVDEFRARWAEMTVKEIAAERGTKYHATYQFLRRHGIKAKAASRDRPQAKSKRRAMARELAAQGLTKTEVASRLGITRERVRQYAVEDGIEFAEHESPGPSIILGLHDAGKTPAEIAQVSGISQSHIRKVIRARGLQPNRARTQVDEIRDLAAQGLALSEVARRLSRRPQQIWSQANRAGIKFEKKLKAGRRK